jgi:uncharacterized protein (TIGR03000 family)
LLFPALADETASATIIVRVPADARVWFDDHATQQVGRSDLRHAAARLGRKYHYTIRAERMSRGGVMSQMKRVSVRAGETTRVDLSELHPEATGYVYLVNNDTRSNGVAVFGQNADGTLTEVSGSPFATGGKGVASDIDEQGGIRIHGGFVLAVNPGSDSIAVLRKGENGRLTPVAGRRSQRPRPHEPDRSRRSGRLLNQAQIRQPPPGVTGLRLGKDGKLTPIPADHPRGRAARPRSIQPGRLIRGDAGLGEDSVASTAKVQADGTLREAGLAGEAVGASGTVGYSWAPKATASSSPTSQCRDRLRHRPPDGRHQPGRRRFATTRWPRATAISKDGRTLYVITS